MPALCKKLIIPVLTIGLIVPYFSTGVFANSNNHDEEDHEDDHHDDHTHDLGEGNNPYPFYIDGDPEKGINILDGRGGSHQSTSEELEEIREQIEEQEKRLETLRREAQEQQKNLQETQQYADSLAGYIANVNQQIGQLERSINIRTEELHSIRLAIQRLNLEIRDKEERIEAAKDQMEQLFREIYRSDSEGIVELLFKYDNFSAFFNQVQARRSLQAAIDDTMNELKILKEELEESRGELGEKQEELESEQDELRNQKLALEQARTSNQQLLRQTRGEESVYQEILAEIRAREQEIQDEIFELENQLRRTLDPDSIPQPASGLLTWPTVSLRVTQGYGCVRSWNSVYSDGGCPTGQIFHNGVDIGARSIGVPNDPILAAQSGTVVGVGDLGNNAYGRWVAIDHHNGLITLYAHLISQNVRMGQTVARGDVIGRMGGGFYQSGIPMPGRGFSTGVHLHFTVYAASQFNIVPVGYGDGRLPTGANLPPFDYLP